jgi:RNA polymerase sigma-70 factor (ECF subfamily)
MQLLQPSNQRVAHTGVAVEGVVNIATSAIGVPEEEPLVSTLEAAYAAYYEPLARYASWLLRDQHLAADIVQEAYARLAARWPGVRNPRAYLFRLVTNLAHSEWRRLAREQAVLSDTEPAQEDGDAVAIRSAVYRLPQKEREVIWLHYYADFSVADIVRLIGRPEGTVKSLLYDGRRRLARALEESS